MKTFKKFRKEDAPVNNVGGGNIAGLGVGAAGEPGIKKKKKKIIIMGIMKRNIKDNFDNNNIMLKQVLDGLDKIDTIVDLKNAVDKPNLIQEKKEPRKTFKQKYNVR